MKRFLSLFALLALIVLVLAACGGQPAPAPTVAPAEPTVAPAEPTVAPAEPAAPLEFGYVLHGLNDFTNVIKKGAEDAGKALGVNVEVTGPSSFEQPTEAQGMFDAMIQKGKDGMAVVPNPGDVWVQTLGAAAGKLPVPVMTANVPSLDAEFGAWFGQDEYGSGVILATELAKILEASGVSEGKIVVGICAPGVSVLTDRYNGFVEGMKGTKFAVSEPYDVTHDIASNYSAWENLASANADMVAAVGLCSIDIPNMAKLKERSGAKWAVGGYDLNVETLDAIKAGTAQVTVGQHPYLQGYLPILALKLATEGKLDVNRSWINVGTEAVTAENVETLYKRESDPAFMTEWYADHIAKTFGDMQSLVVPIEKMGEHAMPAEQPVAGGYKFGYVLHGLNDFTNVIKKGAEDAGAALGDEVEVTGPSSFEQPTEAQGMFDAMIQKGKDGMAVVPNPGDVWVQTLGAAAGKLPVPVMTANVPSLDAEFGAWFGQDEYGSGVILATELAKILEASGVNEGQIVVGICAPGVSVLTDRYNGFVEGMKGTKFAVSEPYDVTHDIASNYSAWENLASANADMVAAVGLCSIDIPNMAKLKERSGAKWAVGGYDLNVETLDAIKAGTAQVTVGQHPYLQGYLPILALHLAQQGKLDVNRSWINVGTEAVTAENVETLYKRESDPAFMTEWYAEHIAKTFGDMQSLAVPIEKMGEHAMPAAMMEPEQTGYKLGYVLHGLNDFTNVIKKGAEDAGKFFGAEVEVTGPSSFEQPTEAQGMFDAMIQKGKDGMAVVPNPGDVWVQTLGASAGKLPVPVMTSNVPSLDAEFGAWFGQDEYGSGVILATELAKILEASGVSKGKIVVGICAPGVSVLTDRYNGFVEGMKGTKFAVSEPYDVTHDIASNYSAWENLASANADMVAAVGLCSIDIPNMAKLKERSGAKWAVGGYDLNVETLDAIKAGTAQVTVGQHPYLQGFLPIMALVRAQQGKLDVNRSWINVGTEAVTAENVDTLYKRESDPAFMTEWYAEHIAKNFSDLQSLVVPIEKMGEH